ncbi:MAG: class I SAM-dependent methyltransferase [Elusimicrobiales bacterium]|jgi:SAM-dependent methyltransferase
MNSAECPVCRHPAASAYMRVRGFQAPEAAEYSLVRCGGCGLIRLSPRPSTDELLRLNRSHFSAPSARLSVISRYSRLRRLYHSFSGEYLAEFLAGSRGRILDAGCGFGGLMEELRACGCEPAGIEPNPEACAHCRSRGFPVSCAPLERTGLPAGSFDGAVLWHVLEHLPDPRAALAEISRLLKPGGTLTVYCPNIRSYAAEFFGASWQGLDPPFHLLHFTPETLERLMRESGFEPVYIRTSSADYFLPHSLAHLRAARPGDLPGRLPPAFLRSLPGRMLLMTLMRALDAVMPRRGECIRARFVLRGGGI